MNWITDFAPWFGMAAGLVSVGMAFGTLPRISKDMDEHKKTSVEDRTALWAAIEESRRDRRRLSERLTRLEMAREVREHE